MTQENLEVENAVVRRWFWPSRTIEGAMRNWKQWLDTWDEHRFDLEKVSEEGDVRFYAHFKVRDDKVVHIFDHGDGAAALEAADLSE
jgi:hypothetical protein